MTVEIGCFNSFTQDVAHIALPKRFTYPFVYQPHPLCVIAAKQLQEQVLEHQNWPHNFGLPDCHHTSLPVIGKMFGVLLVKNKQGELGFLAGYSGKLANQNHIAGFVPPVFDILHHNSFFLTEQAEINRVNQQLEFALIAPHFIELKQQLEQLKQTQESELQELKKRHTMNRQARKNARQVINTQVDGQQKVQELEALAQQSIADKIQLKVLNLEWQQKTQNIAHQIHNHQTHIEQLKTTRRRLSSELQNEIFSRYEFLDRQLERKNLSDIFADTPFKIPPAGAGECAAPKLLQYAFLHGFTPIAIAEFWWGASPSSEIRQHKQFYPACMGKCQPILQHMLQGMSVDDNPLLINSAEHKPLHIVYQDKDIVVVDKPPELLSVPGKEITDSVYTRVKALFPQATGPLIVHRLDMSTSGLMVLALHARANKIVHKQFIKREVTKRYVALLDGLLTEDEGEVCLPLRGDWFDRPKQLVCFKAGKPAHTKWQVVDRNTKTKRTKVYLYPYTGRTHQLRVHCAHSEGLNMPILGDDLYGIKHSRLHLQAQKLTFTHPTTKQIVNFEIEEVF